MLWAPPFFAITIPHQINFTSMSKLLTCHHSFGRSKFATLLRQPPKGVRPPLLLLLVLGKQPKLLPSRSALAELSSSPLALVFVQKVKSLICISKILAWFVYLDWKIASLGGWKGKEMADGKARRGAIRLGLRSVVALNFLLRFLY